MNTGSGDNPEIQGDFSNQEKSKNTAAIMLPSTVPGTIKTTLSYQDEEEESEVDLETVKQSSVAEICGDTRRIGITEGRRNMNIILVALSMI